MANGIEVTVSVETVVVIGEGRAAWEATLVNDHLVGFRTSHLSNDKEGFAWPVLQARQIHSLPCRCEGTGAACAKAEEKAMLGYDLQVHEARVLRKMACAMTSTP